MGGKRPLKAGAVPLLGNHNTVAGRSFRRVFDALDSRWGPFDHLMRLEASRAAAAWVALQASLVAVASARRAREAGHGRRPSTRDVERAARRAGLDGMTYSAAAARVEALAASRPRATLADLISTFRQTTANTAAPSIRLEVSNAPQP